MTLILPLSYLFPFVFHFSFTLCECRPVWDHPRSMLLHSQHQRIAFIFELLAWSTRKRCCVTSQLCAREDHPKLLKDPSGGKKVREIPLLTTSLKTFDLRHQQQPKRASHPVCWKGEGVSHWSAGGQVRTDTPAFTMNFNNNVQGTVFW